MKLYQRIGLALLTSSGVVICILFACWMSGYNFDHRDENTGLVAWMTEIPTIVCGLGVFFATRKDS